MTIKGVYLDPDTKIVGERYAIVYAPRRKRGRFPEDCVEIVESHETAIDQADPDQKRYPAKVLGPSRSSEGLRLYYLVKWLI